MTAAEWHVCTDPQRMLEWVGYAGKASQRKLRLFAVACCRRVWHLLTDLRSRRAVEIAEQLADGAVKKKLRARVVNAAVEASWDHPDSFPDLRRVAELAVSTCDPVLSPFAYDAAVRTAATGSEKRLLAELLRDIFGNPLPVFLDPAWLAWNDRTVEKLARVAYEERQLPSGHLDPHRLGILADALEEAGCADVDVLSHLRGPGPHLRGCHVLDLLRPDYR